MSDSIVNPPADHPPVRVSHRNVVTGELTLELVGDYTVLLVQQRGDFTYVVVKPDPTGEGFQQGQLEKLEALNAGDGLVPEPRPALPDPASGPIPADPPVATGPQ